MDTPTITAFLLGLVAGVIVVALFLPSLNKRVRSRHQVEIDRLDGEIADLRQDQADDREVNRRLRHDLAINTPATLDATVQERDEALEELAGLNRDLQKASVELADRDRSLRQALLAIREIRQELEHGEDTDGPSVEGALALAEEAEEATNGRLLGGFAVGESVGESTTS